MKVSNRFLLVLLLTVTDILRATSTAISTDPPYDPLATGFNNLIVTAQFPAPTSNTDSCAWYYGGELDSEGRALFYSGFTKGCSPPDPGTYDSITCTEQTTDGRNHIVTILTITQPLHSGERNIEVRCSFATTPGPISRTVQDCNSSLPYDVIMDASSRVFNSPGYFVCSNGGELVYSYGEKVTSEDTICLASAKWSGQDNLQCWTAPNVTLASSSIEGGNQLTVVEGNDLTLTCDYNDVIPSGSISRFYFGENSFTRIKGEPFALPAQRSDDSKIVSCQAVSPYTDLYPASGKSPEYELDVLYISSSVTNKIETSQYVIEASESNYLLRSDQQLTMNCTPSDANPPATCSWQLCSDSSCQTLTSDGGCLITVDLNASSTVTCAAENIVGNVTSAEQSIDVVPVERKVQFNVTGSKVERQLQFNVTGSNVVNNGNAKFVIPYGESILMSCSISYQDQLNTTYNLKLPNNTNIPQSSIQFSTVPNFYDQDYVCNTNDQFGNFSSTVYLIFFIIDPIHFGAIIGISCVVAIIIIISVAAFVVFRRRKGLQKRSRNDTTSESRDNIQIPVDQPGYIESPGNDFTKKNSDTNNKKQHEVIVPAKDDGDYVVMSKLTNAKSNNEEVGVTSTESYENIEGAYEEVINTSKTHIEDLSHGPSNGSKIYENEEGPHQEIKNL
ncbi:uncharacterized protein LOC143447054 isoform X2 [Clavelina lepadiformis]|uniref:uncharacterized protein LOC143447054 isoform X2 n=1 Tax=Clavelina lepadiformis TaxID=159417 RepID=UPI004041D495